MDFVSIHLHAAGDIGDVSIDPNLVVAFFLDLFEEFAIVAFTSFHHRGEEGNFLTFEFVDHRIDDLLFGEFHHFFATDVADGIAGAGEQQSQEIIYFGHCTHGTSGVFADRFLFDADDRTQSTHFIYIGAFHIANELACIG